MKKAKSVLLLILVFTFQSFAIPADDVQQATLRLEQERSSLRKQVKKTDQDLKSIISRMLNLGMWEEAKSEIDHNPLIASLDKQLLKIQYSILNNDYKEAEADVKAILDDDPNNVDALRFSAILNIEAWKLKEAEDLTLAILSKHPDDEETALVLGRSLLLQKKYDRALALAQQLKKKNPKYARAYLLEADVYFWNQQPQKAEAPLVTSLELDPFNADARFSYGYAIWRRVDATQLDDMAAQWEMALMINPLHFSTHWHWGNGHTNLTFADYVDKDEKEIRKKLERADELFSEGRLDEAISVIHKVSNEYPQSVLPAMHEASLLYSDFGSANREEELDRSEAIFRDILDRKQHYGPAHNGLAAVIKSKRIRYLSNFDSITNVLNTIEINDPINFTKVFPDMEYYPGDQVKAMVWNQLYSSVVYFPFLSKQGNSFVIPPLHIDLAIAMNSPYFRTNTTFDNRQWMDIRGVGSGAADIGYTERGAYFERNVVLHEYVHLFHGRVLTDQENRQIRERYYHAMENNLTLDYYSQNNESEYFAQTYPAYFEPMKVHPLDFKSMNTTSDLRNKDPEMYNFLDRLVKKERAYLAGDKGAMASNWAQVYVNMSRRAATDNSSLAFSYLDTAMQYDQSYLPAYIAYAQLEQRQKEFNKAKITLEKAQAIDPDYAPVYAAFADLVQVEYLSNKANEKAKEQQVQLLEKAISLEKDYQTAASLHIQLRTVYADFNDLDNAIRVAESYVAKGPKVSTYLRDRVNEAQAFAAANKAFAGDRQQLDILANLVAQNPQNYNFRALYSDALFAHKQYQRSIDNMHTVQRILASSGNSRPDFELRIAESKMELGEGQEVNSILDTLQASDQSWEPYMGQRLVKLLAKAGRKDEAKKVFQNLPQNGTPAYEAVYEESKKLF